MRDETTAVLKAGRPKPSREPHDEPFVEGVEGERVYQDDAPSGSVAAQANREKYRVRYRKAGPLRFIGHLDLLRLWDRLFRRANLTVKPSQGFHPKPIISCPIPLALGLIGDDEIIEIELDEPLADEVVRSRIDQQLVEGLQIVSLERLDRKATARVVGVAFRIDLPSSTVPTDDSSPSDADTELPHNAETLSRRCAALMARESICVRREMPGKPVRDVDLRPFLRSIRAEGNAVFIEAIVAAGSTVRHDELVRLLELEPLLGHCLVVTRTRVLLAGPDDPKPAPKPRRRSMTEAEHRTALEAHELSR